MDIGVLGFSVLAGLVAVSLAGCVQAWNLRRVRAGPRRKHVGPTSPTVAKSPDRKVANNRLGLESLDQALSRDPIVQSTSAAPTPSTRAQQVSPSALVEKADSSVGLRIETLAEFRMFHGNPAGVIVITDGGSRAKVHRADCPSLTEANFSKKVLTNEGRRGGYRFFANFGDAERQLTVRGCKTCLSGNLSQKTASRVTEELLPELFPE